MSRSTGGTRVQAVLLTPARPSRHAAQLRPAPPSEGKGRYVWGRLRRALSRACPPASAASLPCPCSRPRSPIAIPRQIPAPGALLTNPPLPPRASAHFPSLLHLLPHDGVFRALRLLRCRACLLAGCGRGPRGLWRQCVAD